LFSYVSLRIGPHDIRTEIELTVVDVGLRMAHTIRPERIV
jgi:hypothetical protein